MQLSVIDQLGYKLGASPQLECWNNAFWDNAIFGIMVKFVSTIKLKIADILLKTNLPSFQYSIFEASVQASKNVLYFH